MNIYLLGSPWGFSYKEVMEHKWSARVLSGAAGLMEERSGVEVPEISKCYCQNVEVQLKCAEKKVEGKKILKIDFPADLKLDFPSVLFLTACNQLMLVLSKQVLDHLCGFHVVCFSDWWFLKALAAQQ